MKIFNHFNVRKYLILKFYLLFFFGLFFIFSCQKTREDSDNIENGIDTTLNNGYYGEYESEYSKAQEAEDAAAEDAATDENGDIVGGGSTEQNYQKQWVNCKECHGKGTGFCYECKGTGSIDHHSGYGPNTCYNCEGLGYKGNCSYCDGRGQVLIEF